MKKTSLMLVFVTLFALFASSCLRPGEKRYRKSAVIMDTLVTITVASDSKDRAESAIDGAFAEIKRLENILSFWSRDSEIAAIYNNAGVKPVAVSSETLDVVKKALFISEKTGGAFDPTIGPLIRLYDFKKKTGPDEDAIRKTLPLVGWREMAVDEKKSTALLRKKGMSFDTGGIVKGYAADMAVSALREAGIESGLVAIAGDIRAFGGAAWKIGVRNPRSNGSDGPDIMATLELKDEAVSTSGDYERFFVDGGVRYHHLLDPGTGRPARGCMSVSVVAKEGVLADGFSTGIFIMGPEAGLRLLGEMGFEGIIVDDEGKIHVTEGLKDRVRLAASNVSLSE